MALIWRQCGGRVARARRPADRRPPRRRRARGRRTDPRAGARRLYRGGFGVALIVGAALLFLYANGALAGRATWR